MASLSTVVGVALASFGVVAFAGSDDPPATEPIYIAAAKARVVTVTARDFAFDAPDMISAGLTEFRLVNAGPDLHHMQILRLDGGKNFADFEAAMKGPGKPPAWVRSAGGPNAPDPGRTANATMMMEPGNYVLICFVETKGIPHFRHGMYRPLRVVASKAPKAAAPKFDATATLFDYGFKWSAPLRPGLRTIKVVNSGPQYHEIEIVRLAPGKSVTDVLQWIESPNGPPPGNALGGIAAIEPGAHGYFRVQMTPGEYGLICFLLDRKDGKPHFAHGMASQFTVN